MKLYDAGWAPSPRRVRIFLAEKRIEVPRVAVDLRRNEQLGAEYLAINPRGTVPALVLDDGEVVTESHAICRFLEALHPEPALFGTRPIEVARIEEWTRRVEESGYVAAVEAFRNGHPAFAGRALPGAAGAVPQIPALAERAQLRWTSFVATLDERLADGEWIAGATFSFADIMALTTIDFAARARLAIPDEAEHLRRWYDRAAARPSAQA
ncbi:MAG: glutathione S-transferase N-terminal domain-containing protein [Sphingomonas adhaesiva]|uniref:glutathione S-transferase family protein n=1 Tax=Sphingomonas adhaesiva TaxID=28212 RepID=UPI002FFA1774